jgi:hypothetical protein
MRLSNCPTSCWISRWSSAAVFFRGRERWFFHRASAADFLVDGNPLLREFAELLIGCHLALRLLQFGSAGKGLGHRLSFHLASEAKVRTMRRVVGLMAMAARLAAGTVRRGNRPSAEVRQFPDALQDGLALLFQLGEGLGHR